MKTILNHSRLISAAFLLAVALPLAVAAEPPRLDRYDLLKFRDADGQPQQVATAADWQQRFPNLRVS